MEKTRVYRKGDALTWVLGIRRNGTESEGGANGLGKTEGYFLPRNWEAELVRTQ